MRGLPLYPLPPSPRWSLEPPLVGFDLWASHGGAPLNRLRSERSERRVEQSGTLHATKGVRWERCQGCGLYQVHVRGGARPGARSKAPSTGPRRPPGHLGVQHELRLRVGEASEADALWGEQCPP